MDQEDDENILFSQPKLQKDVHQTPATTDQASRPQSGASKLTLPFSESADGELIVRGFSPLNIVGCRW